MTQPGDERKNELWLGLFFLFFVLKDIESAKKDIAKAEKKFEKKLKKDAEKNRAQKEESSLLN